MLSVCVIIQFSYVRYVTLRYVTYVRDRRWRMTADVMLLCTTATASVSLE